MTIWHCICLMWSADVTLQKCHPSADLGVTPQTEQVEILSTSLCLWAVEQMLCQVCPYKRSPRQHLKQVFIFKLRYLFLTIKIEISDIHCSAITYSCNEMSGVNSRRLLSKLWYEKFAQSCPPTFWLTTLQVLRSVERKTNPAWTITFLARHLLRIRIPLCSTNLILGCTLWDF